MPQQDIQNDEGGSGKSCMREKRMGKPRDNEQSGKSDEENEKAKSCHHQNSKCMSDHIKSHQLLPLNSGKHLAEKGFGQNVPVGQHGVEDE
jgi:hypothetical protein